MKTTTTTIRLRNTLTGKYFSKGAWASNFSDAEIIEKDGPTYFVIRHAWDLTHAEEIPVDDSKKVVKLNSWHGSTTHSYKGILIYSERKSKGDGVYTRRENWTETHFTLGGKTHYTSGVRQAKKIIDNH